MNHGMEPKFFSERARKSDLTVGVIGLGYVGLPTAIGFHDAGFRVWGVDISQHTVDTVLKEKIQQVTLTSTISFPNRVLSVGISPPRQAKQSNIAMWFWSPCPPP